MMFDEYYRRKWEDTDHDISYHQTEFATKLRIPILATSHPRWNYITGIVVCDNILDHGIMPEEHEITAVADQLRRYNLYYRQPFLDAMRQFAPYDIDGGANLGYYPKRPDGCWTYRKRTWESPRWSKHFGELEEVLDRNFQGWSAIPESMAGGAS